MAANWRIDTLLSSRLAADRLAERGRRSGAFHRSQDISGSTSRMGQPLWRKAFDEVDRRVAGPVEKGAHSDLFGDLVALRGAGPARAARGRAPHPPRAHAVNLPTATDVRRLSEQVASLQREVRDLDERRRP